MHSQLLPMISIWSYFQISLSVGHRQTGPGLAQHLYSLSSGKLRLSMVPPSNGLVNHAVTLWIEGVHCCTDGLRDWTPALPSSNTFGYQDLGISKAKHFIWGLGVSDVSCCPGKISSLGEVPQSLRNLSESIKVILRHKTQNPSPQREGSTLPRHQHDLPSAIIADKNGRTL